MQKMAPGSSSHAIVNFTHHIDAHLAKQRLQSVQCSELSADHVNDILSRHEYPDDREGMEIDRKRRIGHILTLHQQEYITKIKPLADEQFQAEQRKIQRYNANSRLVTLHWHKREYSTGVKILLDNIDEIFESETTQHIEGLVKMLQVALNSTSSKKQKSNLTQAINTFSKRLEIQKQPTPPETEITV